MNDARRKSFHTFLEWTQIGGMRLQETSPFFIPTLQGVITSFYEI